jgi:hypothetical protein
VEKAQDILQKISRILDIRKAKLVSCRTVANVLIKSDRVVGSTEEGVLWYMSPWHKVTAMDVKSLIQ